MMILNIDLGAKINLSITDFNVSNAFAAKGHKMDFSKITACGECCDGCQKKNDGICIGCIEADGYVSEWAGSGRCKVHACTRNHNVQFCGLCACFPCDNLAKLIHWNKNIVEHQSELADKYKN